MSKKKTSEPLKKLRKKAESRIKYEKIPLHKIPEADVVEMIHELQVHQVELQMQNEELRRAQVELEESRSRYTDLYDFAPVGYFVLDVKGVIVDVNLTGTAQLGLERETLLKRLFVLHVREEDRDHFYRCRRNMLKTAAHQRCELVLLRKDKPEFFAELIMDPVKDAEGNVIRCKIAIIDINQRKKAERELVESKEQLRLVLESGNAGTWNWDVQTENIEWNEQMYEIIGLSPDVREITIETFFHYIHPKDLPQVKGNIAKALKSGTDFKDVFRIVREDGEVRWLSGRSHVFQNEQAKVVRIMGVYLDITERQRIAEAVQAERQKLRNILDSIPDAVYIVNRQGGVEYVNPEMEKQNGPWTGQKCYQYRMGRDEPCPSCTFNQILEGKTVREEWADERNGRIYDCIDAPLVNPDGSISKLKIKRDVTETKRAEERLQQKHREIGLANRIFAMFVDETGNKLFDKVLETLLEAMKSQYGVFGYVDEQGNLMCPTMSRIFDKCEIVDKCICYPRDKWKGLWSRALLEKRTFYTNDPPAIPTGHVPISNNLATPILFQGEVIGLFNFANKTGGYTEQDQQFIEAMAARIAPVLYAWIQRELRDKERQQAEAAMREAKDQLEQNVAKLETTLDNLTEGLVISDLEGNMFHWNPAAVAMHGFTSMEECERKLPEFADIFELSTEADGVLPLEQWPLARILCGETLRDWEVNIRRHGSNWHRVFNYGGTLARNKDGESLLAVVSVTDITARKQAAEQISMLARFPSENPSPVLRIASDGTILYSNDSGLAVLENWDRNVGQKVPRDWYKRVAQALDSEKNVVRELKCGKSLFSLVAAPVVEGKYVNIYGRDITKEKEASLALQKAHAELEKKVRQRTAELADTVKTLQEEAKNRMRAEQAVRERSRVLDAFFSHTIMPLAILDKEFNFLRVNQAYADADERDISEFQGQNHFKLYPHEENQRIFEEVVRTKTPYEAVAKPFSFPDHPEWGVTYWDWTLVPVFDETGEVELLIFSLEDVTARKRSELALEESEARHRALVELSPDPIVVVESDIIAFVNNACVELAGLHYADELIGRQIWDFIHPESRLATETLLRATQRGSRRIGLTELKTIRHDGKIVEVEVSAAPIRYKGHPAMQAVLRDITERKVAENRRRITNTLLELFSKKSSLQEYLDSVVETIRDWSGCRCVGVRIIDEADYIPYRSYLGFSEEFLSAENMLCLGKDMCVCVRLTLQTPDPQEAYLMTERGSFRCDDTLRFVESLIEPERDRYRGNCVRHGFKSVAVVPIRYRQKIFGVIHLADEHENKVPLESVEFLENMAILIGEALHRFNVEHALRSSESRLLEAQRIAHLGYWDVDYITNKLWWSEEVYRIFGLKHEQFGATYEAFLSFVHPEDREAVETAVNEAMYNQKPYSIDHRIIRPDGSQRFVHERAKVFYNEEDIPFRMMGTVQDISELKLAEERILADQEALRSLTSQLQLAEESERRQLASDLHDSIGQNLALSKWELVRLQKSAPADIADVLQKVVSQLDTAVKQARTLSFELSPSVLYDLGLEVALEDMVEQFSRETNITCRLESVGERQPLSDAVKVFLYRSVRELLINVTKHARATEVTVALQSNDNELRVTVEDNGKGFNVSALDVPPGKARGFGVLNIRERLRYIGGRFEIESDIRNGTKVTLVAPINN